MSSSLFPVLLECFHVCTKEIVCCITFSLSHEAELFIANVMAMSSALKRGTSCSGIAFVEPEDSGDRVVRPLIIFSVAMFARLCEPVQIGRSADQVQLYSILNGKCGLCVPEVPSGANWRHKGNSDVETVCEVTRLRHESISRVTAFAQRSMKNIVHFEPLRDKRQLSLVRGVT